MTLYHWDLPQAIEEVGGWRNRDTASLFADNSTAVVERIGDRVRDWATLNEPFCSASAGAISSAVVPARTNSPVFANRR